MRRGPAAREARRDLVERQPGGAADGRRRRARCGPTAGRASGSSTRPARAVRARGVKRIPSSAGRVDALGADVGVVGEPVASRCARPTARPIRRTIGSSALRIAVPSGGSASSSSPLAASIASSEPIRDEVDRLDRGDDPDPRPGDPRPARRSRRRRTCPSRGRPPRAPARAAGAVSGRPTSLFWLPSLRSVRKRLAEDRRDRLLGRGLGDAPGHPDDERVEPAPPAGRDGAERRERIGDPDDRDVAERSTDRRRAGSRGAPPRRARPRRPGRRGRRCARRAGRRTARPGSTRRESTAAPRIGSVGAGEEPAAGQADQVVGVRAGAGDRARSRGRRIDVGHGGQCRTGRAHRSAAASGGRGSPVGSVGSRSGVVIASVAMRRKSSNDITGISRWPTRSDGRRALLDLDRRRRGPGRPSGGRCSRRTSS